MLDCILDGVIDTLKLLPYLLITFIILELLEHKLSKKNRKVLSKNRQYGPILGGLLGALPQCGFSSMASNLFSSHVITIGTLIAVFLSTSDEMLPIMLSEHVDFLLILKIVMAKVFLGVIIGFIIDIIFMKKNKKDELHITEICEEEHCSCEKNGIIISSIKHTLHIGIFILIANLCINLIIFGIGEDNLSIFLKQKNILTLFSSIFVGLIPNCASSVVMTELYLSNFITIGNLMAGLLTGSGIGILLLFKTNKNLKENFLILSIIYIVGVSIGVITDFIV